MTYRFIDGDKIKGLQVDEKKVPKKNYRYDYSAGIIDFSGNYAGTVVLNSK